MVFQSYALCSAPERGGQRRVRPAHAPRSGRRARDGGQDALELVKLDAHADRYPRQSRGGQQQRVALARAIVIKPAVLLLDEPLGALDKMLREEMQVELRSLQQRLGITAVFVTHDQEEALTLSDRVAVMRNGVIEQMGAPREIYERTAQRVRGGISWAQAISWTASSYPATGRERWWRPAAGRVPRRSRHWLAGSEVRIAIRPNGCAWETPRWEGLRARIRDIVYRGPITHLYLTTAAGPLLSYQQNSAAQTWRCRRRCAMRLGRRERDRRGARNAHERRVGVGARDSAARDGAAVLRRAAGVSVLGEPARRPRNASSTVMRSRWRTT
jgi:putative spermidine/putrescine transport system ATP-binding protein/spermidine/putrescine transport system ATP-binding protein